MTRKATDQVTTIGIDIGKNNFHLIGLDGAGNIVLRRKLSRSQVIGARRETRTLKVLPPADFESAASTNSAIRARAAS